MAASDGRGGTCGRPRPAASADIRRDAVAKPGNVRVLGRDASMTVQARLRCGPCRRRRAPRSPPRTRPARVPAGGRSFAPGRMSGVRLAPVIATSRPPSAGGQRRREMPQRRVRNPPLDLGDTENGGFINTTLGRTPPSGRRSGRRRAAMTGDVANSCSSSPARVGASSFNVRAAPASSAKIANSPVPAEGSSTTSAGVRPAATLATNQAADRR